MEEKQILRTGKQGALLAVHSFLFHYCHKMFIEALPNYVYWTDCFFTSQLEKFNQLKLYLKF